jgi:methylmalonyl-CoA/ethylmalonyl-CoA epimerase
MLRKLNHIGILVDDLKNAITKFEEFGLKLTEVRENRKIGAEIAFLSIGDTSLEIIRHTGPDKGDDAMVSVVREQKGPINHLCFDVDDFEATIRHFEKSGAKLVEGCPRAGAHGQIAFFYPKTTEGVLIEFYEA